ncbi:MAG: HpcH/HpaI aldolase/citrate lyase family protein [Terriglobales bacterium]
MGTGLRLERTLLFVPGNQRRKIEKAAASAADAVCLDLEDAVPDELKAGSRAEVIAALRELDFGRRLRVVRINGLETRWAERDLVEVVGAVGDRLDLVMLPKVSGAGDVEYVDRMLTQIGAAHIGIEAQIETARGYLYCREIAGASPRLETLIFGAGDFAASMQMPSSGIGAWDEYDALYPGHRWHAPMLTIVAAARAFGLRCLDSPYGAYQDAAGFERSCRIAHALGFDGKQCIHPAQLDITHRVFTPTAEQAASAASLVAAYEQAAGGGRGAFSHEGKMVDAANVRMAQVIVAKARLCGLLP